MLAGLPVAALSESRTLFELGLAAVLAAAPLIAGAPGIGGPGRLKRPS